MSQAAQVLGLKCTNEMITGFLNLVPNPSLSKFPKPSKLFLSELSLTLLVKLLALQPKIVGHFVLSAGSTGKLVESNQMVTLPLGLFSKLHQCHSAT